MNHTNKVIIHTIRLLGASIFSDGFRSLADCVFGELAGKEQADGGLHFPRRDRWPLVVVSQTGRLGRDTFENIVDKGIHYRHSLTRDSSVRVNLLQHFVNVNGVTLFPFVLLLSFVRFRYVFLCGTGFFRCFPTRFWRHGCYNVRSSQNARSVWYWKSTPCIIYRVKTDRVTVRGRVSDSDQWKRRSTMQCMEENIINKLNNMLLLESFLLCHLFFLILFYFFLRFIMLWWLWCQRQRILLEKLNLEYIQLLWV